MRSRRLSGSRFLVRLDRGEKVIESLRSFLRQEGINAGLVQGIGAVENAELAFYHLDAKRYAIRKIAGPMELVSFLGNIAVKDGAPFIHVHACLADADLKPVAGHLVEAEVAVLGEFTVEAFDAKVVREHEEDLGLAGWKL